MHWRKILYVKQQFPDNHVHATFLDELTGGSNNSYEYHTLCLSALPIALQLNLILLFVASFKLLPILESRYMLLVLLPILPLLPFSYSTIILPVITLGLAPILKTLTKDISLDTVYALTTLAFAINLIWNDYSGYSCLIIQDPQTHFQSMLQYLHQYYWHPGYLQISKYSV